MNPETKIEDIRSAGLDQFYTLPEVAMSCIQRVGTHYPWTEWGLVIEPSAGKGSFLCSIPTDKKIGMDLSPGHPSIFQQDFLMYTPPADTGKRLTIGNPPFGRVSSLAIKFFNHAALWTDVIAFIVPRTFRRISVQNKLNLHFHLVWDEDIPMVPCSFTPPMMAKCCFQIWEKKEVMRSKMDLPTTHPDWDFLGLGPKDEKGQPTPPGDADFVLRAYGGKCGEIIETGLAHLRPKSWHWIKCKVQKQLLIERFNQLDYTVSRDTARQNSIGRGELVRLYSHSYD